jgi:glucose-1-phosphate thymidylyltransferase
VDLEDVSGIFGKGGKMKGVVLCGGLGTRLYPLTKVTNKHLLPMPQKDGLGPMVLIPINTLISAGIREIMLVIGGPFLGQFLELLKDFDKAEIVYAVQPHERGIADALRYARKFVGNDNVCVILGDNCTDTDISEAVKKFDENFSYKNPGCHLFLKRVEDPSRFGVAVFGDGGSLVGIVEKPQVPPSEWAVAGIYLYTPDVFYRVEKLIPSERGELEITDINNSYIEAGRATWSELTGFWADAGTPKSYIRTFIHWIWRSQLV